MNFLPLVPIEEIQEKAIPYIKSKIPHGPHTSKLDAFWKYFFATWMKKYEPSLWNIHHIPTNAEDDVLINRTNCGLECYNRTLQAAFPVPHPNIQNFVKTIAGEANRVVEDLQNIQRGFLPLPTPTSANIPSISSDYFLFKKSRTATDFHQKRSTKCLCVCN
jgi:hypothetical protein